MSALKTWLACAVLVPAAGIAQTQAPAQPPAQPQTQPQPPAQEALFVAQVESITLAPRGGRACPELCPATFSRNADGSTHVCIANDGGCQTTEVHVGRVLLGNQAPGPYTFDARIGEWGDTHFPVTHAPILVHVRPGMVEWAPMTSKDGRQLVRVKAFRFGVVAGVDVRALAPRDGDGDGVALDTLAERLAAGR